jgi:hypothetical protein
MLARLGPRPETRNLSPQVYPTLGSSRRTPTEHTASARRIFTPMGEDTTIVLSTYAAVNLNVAGFQG